MTYSQTFEGVCGNTLEINQLKIGFVFLPRLVLAKSHFKERSTTILQILLIYLQQTVLFKLRDFLNKTFSINTTPQQAKRQKIGALSFEDIPSKRAYVVGAI